MAMQIAVDPIIQMMKDDSRKSWWGKVSSMRYTVYSYLLYMHNSELQHALSKEDIYVLSIVSKRGFMRERWRNILENKLFAICSGDFDQKMQGVTFAYYYGQRNVVQAFLPSLVEEAQEVGNLEICKTFCGEKDFPLLAKIEDKLRVRRNLPLSA